MYLKQTQGKDALYCLIIQKHEHMAKSTFDHDYLTFDFDPSNWYKNDICIKQVLHLGPAAPSQMNKQLGLIESPAYFQTIRPKHNRTNASMNQFTYYQNTTDQLHGYRPKCSWEHGNLQ